MLEGVWAEHPPAAMMRRKQASSPDSPSTPRRRPAESSVEFVSVELFADIGATTVDSVVAAASVETGEAVVTLFADIGATTVDSVVAAASVETGEAVVTFVSSGSGTALQKLLSNDTST